MSSYSIVDTTTLHHSSLGWLTSFVGVRPILSFFFLTSKFSFSLASLSSKKNYKLGTQFTRTCVMISNFVPRALRVRREGPGDEVASYQHRHQQNWVWPLHENAIFLHNPLHFLAVFFEQDLWMISSGKIQNTRLSLQFSGFPCESAWKWGIWLMPW